MVDTIVIGVDGSDTSQAALSAAVSLAGRLSASVHVLTVVETHRNQFTFGVEEVDDLNRAAEQLHDELLAAHADDGVEITAVVRRGRPHEVLLSYAEEVDADLLVVGKRGDDGLEQFLLGSTADRLARLTEIPLWIVPAPTADHGS